MSDESERERFEKCLEFVRYMRDTTNCVCKGKIGKIQKQFGTNVRCIRCWAAEIASEHGLKEE